MSRPSAIAALAVLLCTILAGCTAEETPSGELKGVGAGFVDDTSGAVLGIVVDEAELPVAGVRVSLVKAADESVVEEITTTDDGSFSFVRIEPGAYRVKTFILGYADSIIDVEIVAGQAMDNVVLRLVQGRTDSAFYITDFLRRQVGGGMVKATPDCMFIDLTPYGSPVGPGTTKTCQGVNACPAQLGCTDGASGCLGNYDADGGYGEFLENNTNWQTMLAEVFWRPSSAVSGRGMLHETLAPLVTGNSRCGGINQQDPRDFLVISDQPPIRTVINDEILAERGLSAPEERCCDWRMRLFPAWCDLGNCDRFGPDVNVAGTLVPTPADVYFSIFVKEAMPDDWTALPPS